MSTDDTIFEVSFVHSQETQQVPLSVLQQAAVDFLAYYGEAYLLGYPFYDIVGEGSGGTRLNRLMAATGYPDNAKGFFAEIMDKIGAATSAEPTTITMNGIVLPYLFILALLEKVMPGNRFITIRDVDQFEKYANVGIPANDRNALQEVIDLYPVRLSMHTLRQMRLSRNITYQYAPFVEELDPVGQTNTWIGQFHQGLLEQMYRNRVIFLLNMSCPVYCRFCFRKHKESRNQTNPTEQDVQNAVDYIKSTPTVKEIVITGGDPFLNKKNMMRTIDGLKEIPHVQTLRLATRSISYYPHLFYDNDKFWLNYLKMKSLELRQLGKRIEIATHFIHPDEISLQSLDIISDFVKNGLAVYVQTPFLNDCNDTGPELTRLFSLLRGAGAELHYIYIPCSPIHGNSVYWSPISKGLAVSRYLRAHLSDRVMPRICTATPIGKMDWHSSGWAVEKDAADDHFFWIRTPYTPEYFKAFAEKVDQLPGVRVNPEGTLDARFMARIGDESLFLGSRPPAVEKTDTADEAALTALQSLALENQKIGNAIVPSSTPTLFRSHETRIEIDAGAGANDLAAIEKDRRVTDVVITSQGDALDHLYEIEGLIEKLQAIQHVNAVRLRSLKFNYRPENFTKGVIERLGELNRLTIANPLRLEIETQFLHAAELKPIHKHLAAELNGKGITVYSNTPLLTDVNDNPAGMNHLAFTLRQMGIEFHHIYVAGWPLQKEWNAEHPLDISNVIDIASRIRKDGSGREIPRYIILTELGEIDFGLTSRIFEQEGKLFLKLLAYDLAYFQNLDPSYQWPASVSADESGHPVVPVSGLTNSADFWLSSN